MLSVIATGAFTARGSLNAQAPKSQWEGVFTDAQARRGETVYADQCESCHGPDLTGGEFAPAVTGKDFNANWNDSSLGELFEKIRVSMPLNAPGTLSSQQSADVLAYVLSKGFPAGSTELPAQTEALKGIKFIAQKPAQ